MLTLPQHMEKKDPFSTNYPLVLRSDAVVHTMHGRPQTKTGGCAAMKVSMESKGDTRVAAERGEHGPTLKVHEMVV